MAGLSAKPSPLLVGLAGPSAYTQVGDKPTDPLPSCSALLVNGRFSRCVWSPRAGREALHTKTLGVAFSKLGLSSASLAHLVPTS